MVQYNVRNNIDNQCKKSQLLSLMQTIKGHRNIRRCGNSLACRWCCAYVYHWVKYIGSVKHRAFELMTKVVLCMFPLKRNCRVFFYIKGIAYKCSEIALRFEIQLLLETFFWQARLFPWDWFEDRMLRPHKLFHQDYEQSASATITE
jgi:hypothetical protein